MASKTNSNVKAAIILGTFILLSVIIGGCCLLTNTILRLSLSESDPVSDRRSPAKTCQLTEEVVLPYSRGNDGVATQFTYAGPVEIIVSGTGQAAGSAHSDAFYLFTDGDGFLITPEELDDWLLTINGDFARAAIIDGRIPAYSDEHIYTFEINAPGGVLHFGIMDGYAVDNAGRLFISLCQK
jgi:hypothetical protein